MCAGAALRPCAPLACSAAAAAAARTRELAAESALGAAFVCVGDEGIEAAHHNVPPHLTNGIDEGNQLRTAARAR
jgi:hypothetical protein